MPDPPSGLAEALGDRYRIERELGHGGMATVYLAHDLRHDRPVALKVLRAELARTLGPERFLREIRLAAGLQHPHILGVHDSGEAAGQLWFTMPYVDGESLRDALSRSAPLGLDQALRIAREVADALHYAHQHGVVHRDIKPENILLSGPHALVADFGIAKSVDQASASLTETGITVGTPQYMSPEQGAGERALDRRTDIYSLGCVTYEMLAGEPPFTGATAQAVIAKRLREPVPRLGTLRQVPVHVERAVTRALARAPADRFATAAELADALAAEPERPSRWPRIRVAAVGLLLGLVGGYLALQRSGDPDGGNAVEGPAEASAAVLPFADMSPQGDQQYFSDGLTEELITSLSRIEGLRVAARTASFQFKGKNADVRDVGRRLRVGSVLEGSVRRSGNRLRVTAQLVSARDGYQLWSSAYDRELADVFAVQEDIARAIVEALRVRLGAGSDSALGARWTGDLEAYDLFLKGRFALNQRTQASLPAAVGYFEEAVGRDSTLIRAYAGLADAYVLLPAYAGVSPAESWPKAKAAAARALALDSTLSEAHASLAYGTMQFEWDWKAAEASFRRAIAADPSYATAHHWYADFLAGRGRLEESVREMRRAHELDPLSRIIGVELAWVYCLRRDIAESDAQLRRMLALDQNYAHAHFVLALLRIRERRYSEAIASLERGIELGGPLPHALAALAFAHAVSGQPAAARKILADMQRRSATEYMPPFGFAVTYAGLGDATRAIQYLHRAIDQRDVYLSENFFDPMLDPVRTDPRYPGVLQRMGLGPPIGETPPAARHPR